MDDDDLTAVELELVARARQEKSLEIAERGLQLLDDAGADWFGTGEHATLIIDVLKSVILNACGCTCTPARRHGGPITHAQDVICPVHGNGEHTHTPLPGRPTMRQVWRRRDLNSGGSSEYHSLEALEASIAEHHPDKAWWDADPAGFALETSWKVTVGGMLIVAPWTLIRTVTRSQPTETDSC